MQQLTIKVRARTAKEAVNLGFIVARKYFFPLLFAVLPMWFFAVLLAGLVWNFTHSLSYAILIVWWLKPIYERPAVKRLSRLIFSQEGDFKSDQKAAFAKGLLMELTLLRLFRGNMINRHAVNILEGVSGSERRERIRFVGRAGISGSAILVLATLESLLVYTVVLLIPNLPDIPWQLLALDDYLAFEESVYWLLSLLAVLYIIVCALSTVFFVGIGFMRYINHRIISEGWAIALDLQTLATRLLGIVCVVLLAFSLCIYSPPAMAVSESLRNEDSELVQQMVNDPKMGPYEMREKRIYKDRSWANPLPNLAFAQWAKVLILVVVVLMLLYVFVTILRRQRWSVARAKRQQTIDVVGVYRSDGIGLTASSIDKAWTFLQTGQLIEALAVLYGRLAAEPVAHHIPVFIAGESETEYLRRGKTSIAAANYDFICALFEQWQLGVYAHQELSKDDVSNLILHYQSLYADRGGVR